MAVHGIVKEPKENVRASSFRDMYSFKLSEGSSPILFAIILAALSLAVLALVSRRPAKGKQPPCLSERIPFVTNLYQHWTDMHQFLKRTEKALKSSSVVKIRLGPTAVYALRGTENIKELFRTGSTTSIDDSNIIVMASERQWAMEKKDCSKIRRDNSGRSRYPLPGTEQLPDEKRFFFGMHHIYTEHLTQSRASNRLAGVFYDFLAEKFDAQPIGTWGIISLCSYITHCVTESAIRTLLGSRIVEQHQDFVEKFWAFDRGAVLLYFGVPRWVNSKPFEARDCLIRILKDYIGFADESNLDHTARSDTIWEERAGSSVARSLVEFYRKLDFEEDGIAGFFGGLLLAQNSNTIPTAIWIILEAIRDPELFQALRKEVSQVFSDDEKHTVDAPKLLSLPLLQSVYTETLRLHMSFSIPRTARQKMVLDGYEIPKGAFLFAPMEVAHLDETIWASQGHPASEFWAERHLKHTESVNQATGSKSLQPEFSIAGGSNAFFPFGGGAAICPGRNFARQEIFLIVATLLTKFDIKFLEWANLKDGSKSDRPGKNDERYAGMAAMPPDREMKIRLKRRW